jgi:hypothetical protein
MLEAVRARSSAAASAAMPGLVSASGALEVDPSALMTFIATGQMPPTAIQAAANDPDAKDPYVEQADRILANLSGYGERLRVAGQHAEQKYADVQEQEKALSEQFMPTQLALEGLIKTAATQAAKAEAGTLLERLTKLHYDQVAILDRSARFWEEHVAKEKELRRIAEAKTRLEESNLASKPLQEQATAVAMQETADAEEARMQIWLQGFEKQLKAEEQAIHEQAVAANAPPAVESATLAKLRQQVIDETAKAAEGALKETLPTV